jgi:thiamine pyrophosphate-dependent acetolactate synthase large subunit-like protein
MRFFVWPRSSRRRSPTLPGAKDSLEYDNPYNVGMTGIVGNEAAYHAILKCDTLLLLGADFA